LIKFILKVVLYLFGAISTIFRYVIFPYIYIFCGKTDGHALVKKPFHLTLLFSCPYLFIVFFGYYNYNSSIGIYTVLGSDAYSYTLVPALMIWFGNESKTIDKWIFSRDFFFGWLATYMFFTMSQDSAPQGWMRPAIQLIPFFIYMLVQGKDEDWKEKMR
jgi:Ca2+/Na+ antiporter